MDEFDALRREATKLERHLEDRVARYQQLAQRLTTTTTTSGSGSLLQNPDVETGMMVTEEEAQLRNDIQRTLSSLGDLIQQKLSPAAERSGKSQHLLLVKRYREILFDLTGDFQKTSATLSRKREQAELFRGANSSGRTQQQQHDPAMEQLLRERSHINNSLTATSNVLGQAQDVHADLKQQGTSLRGVSGTMTVIVGNIPGLNRLVDNIRRRRSRDDMVVAGVIASCILFTLWYLFG